MTRLYIVRHCEAMGNINRIFHGITDSKISERGVEQLKFLSERFKDIKIDKIYSSPLERTRKTADAVNKYHGLPVIIKENIIEINGGCIEGLPWKQLPELHPELAKDWNLEPHNFAPEGGESMRQLHQRIWEAMNQIIDESRGQTVAVVTHGCAIRNFLCRVMGYPIERLPEVEWCDNTGISMLEVDDHNNFSIGFINDITHLPPELSTFSHQNWWRRENIERLSFD